MIISQTPLRISFFGGGTDFADFFRQEGGCVISSAIDKYIYVVVKERFDEMIRVGYTRTELVSQVEDLAHDLVREALIKTDVTRQIEVNTMADIPSSGSGLGSSSTVTVGVLNALYAYQNDLQTRESLAHQACEIEIDQLGRPIGKQDQYIAAYGGLRFIRFCQNDAVVVETVKMSISERRRLNQQLMLFYTNSSRLSEIILSEQKENIQARIDDLKEMKKMAYFARDLLEKGDFDAFGYLLNEGWQLKRTLASKISNPYLDDLYQTAISAGALGGKITGAGGGGFLLLYCPRERQYEVRSALSTLQELPFHLEEDGSKIIFNYRRSA
jgi:D-glycero-alpha-D-manno-heptose-7-phosphate kinase